MTTYFTKCGREFQKSTNAETTGYHIPDEWASMDNVRKAGRIKDDECRKCPFPVEVTEGYPPVFKRYECRAGSQPPNHENSYNGSADDKCTLRVYSIDHEFCENVIEFAQNHPELSASYNQDLSDCRRAVSVSCSGNKKGMVAKQELIDKFFPVQDATPDETFEHEAESICGNCENYDPTGEDLGICELTNKSVSRVRPGCDDFDPDTFDEEDLDSMNLEDQLNVLLEQGDAKDKKSESVRKPKCPFAKVIGEDFIQCLGPMARRLGTVEFDSKNACREKTDNHCYNRFHECDDYRKYYADPSTQDSKTCIHCCNNSWYAGLPEGHSGQEWCFCQMKQEPRKHDEPGCEWFNRHPDWALEETLEVESIETDFQNDGHACGNCCIGHWYSGENTYTNVVQDDGIKTVKRPCEPKTHYCYQVVGDQRKIAPDKDFDPDKAPEWCPLGEAVSPELGPKKPRFNRGGECQKMQEDCPCFCAHNDGCAVLLASGDALKAFIDEYRKGEPISCEVFDERVDFVYRSPDPVIETAPSVIELAEPVAAFDYSELDKDTIDALKMIENEITRIKTQTVYDIGSYLKIANETLAKAGHGTFGSWCESIGFSRQSAQNYIQAYDFICRNFDRPDQAIDIQPSLLFAASKPSAPPELQQAVVDGDITKHKDYIKAMEELKRAEGVLEAYQANERGYKKRIEEAERQQEASAKSYQDSSRRVQELVNDQVDRNRKIFELEQQIEKIKQNADPDKLQEMGVVIKEKQDAIDELKAKVVELNDQLNAKPIEVPASEICEVIPEDIGRLWASSIESAIRLLAGLDNAAIDRLIRIEGTKNYAFMKDRYRLNVMEAKANLKVLIDLIYKVPPGAADFTKWADEQGLAN